MSINPEQLQYSKEHEWLTAPDDGTSTVGITSHAADALGDVVFVQLPEVGATVTAGESCGELESTKSVSDVFSPVSGEVVARNDSLDGASEVINTDPYGEGWLFKVRASEEDPTQGLLGPEQYGSLVSS